MVGHRTTDQLHAYKVRKVLQSVYTRKTLETKNGYKLYKWIHRYFDDSNWKVCNFWVAKTDLAGVHRGEILFDGEELNRYLQLGGKVRPIETYSKETRKRLKYLIDVFDIPYNNQYGFTAGGDLFKVWDKIDGKHSVLLVDLENAFNQITEYQIFLILKVVFNLNEKDSRRFAKVMCTKGHLFQGNPLSPLIFNIWSSSLMKTFEDCNIEAYQYADDITIISKYEYISYRFSRFITKLIKAQGFKVNAKKLEKQSSDYIKTLGLVRKWQPKEKGKAIYPKRKRALKNKIKYLQFLIEIRGMKYSRRRARDGTLIELEHVLKGLNNWLNRVAEYSALATYIIA